MAKVINQDTDNKTKAGRGFKAEEYPGSSKYQMPPLPAQGMTDVQAGASGEPFTKRTKQHLKG